MSAREESPSQDRPSVSARRTLRNRLALVTPRRVRMAVKRYEYRQSLARSARRNAELVEQRHLVIGQARTGSSFLVSLLNSLSGVRNVGEIMNPKLVQGMRRSRTAPWEVRRHLVNSLDASEEPISGAKLLMDQMRLHRLTPERIARWVPGVRVVLLYRARQLEQYVSRLTALATGVWQLRANAMRPDLAQVHVDPEGYRQFAGDARWRYGSLVTELERLEVSFVPLSYESLASGASRVFEDRVCPFLGVPTGPLTSHLTKISTSPLSTRISNFEEVAHLAEVEWHPEWDSDEQLRSKLDR